VVVNDCVDDTGGRPGTEGVVGVLALEPGRESTRVATSNHDPLRLDTVLGSEFNVLLIDEVSNISKCLLRGEELKVFGGPIFVGL